MNDFHKIFIAIAVILTTAISSCLSDAGNGEESVTKLGLEHSYDEVRNGVRLILAYDMTSNSFNGTVENTTISMLTARNTSNPIRNTKNEKRLAASLFQLNEAEFCFTPRALSITRTM